MRITYAQNKMEVNNQKTTGIRALGPVNIQALLERLDALMWDTPEDFDANYNKNDRGALRKTQHVILRFADKRGDKIHYKNTSRWNSWKSVLLPIMDAATEVYAYQQGFYPKVMLAKLPANQFIPPHIDGGIKGYVPHKIHVPLLTNEKAFFFLDKERHHLEAGHAYEVNNGQRHSVVNGGDSDRIHLIFEYLNAELQPTYIQNQIKLLDSSGN